eukprot:m.318896 g.318896  ORF g.318896 m.318896 type:complete len:306 (+) comp27579_c0_seq1:638-1555(+)
MWWLCCTYTHTRAVCCLRHTLQEDILISNITTMNPGFWNLVPVHSRRITITDLNVSARWKADVSPTGESPYRTPNTDGIEPMWSSSVLVQRARILNGDDCVTVKSGSHDVLIEDLYCEHGNGMTVGSVWYDDVVNVTYRRVTMNGTHSGPVIKGRSQGNATVRDILFEDVTLIGVHQAVTVDCVYESAGSVAPNIGVQVVNVTYRNVSGTVIPTAARGPSAPTAGRMDARTLGDSRAARAPNPMKLSDAAGTFVCMPDRPCAVTIDGVSVSHANVKTGTPPPWLCRNATVAVGPGGVMPRLTGGC